MDNGIGHTVAMFAAIAFVALVALAHNKINNPSPPPPEVATDTASDQGKRSNGSAGPRGDVDHGTGDDVYIPDTEPDVLYASRVGWYEDDPINPGATHVYYVPRDLWEAAQEEPLPRWKAWLGL
jgi:hypothetical protein